MAQADAAEGVSGSPRGRGITRRWLLGALGGLAVGLGGLAWWITCGKTRPAGADEDTPSPLRVWLQVNHLVWRGGSDFEVPAPLGTISSAARYDDGVTLEVELSAPACFYLIAFNFDGTEQLLWPADTSDESAPTLPPSWLERLRFPTDRQAVLRLNDNARSGLQAYVVAASRQPLPAYAEWRQGRTVRWQSLPAGRTVWHADATACWAVVPGVGVNRGELKRRQEHPPLRELCRALLGGGVEVVEALAFPVLEREDGR